jgi:hypothetical protein
MKLQPAYLHFRGVPGINDYGWEGRVARLPYALQTKQGISIDQLGVYAE